MPTCSSFFPAWEVVGKKLTTLMPKRFRARHEAGLLRYLTTGKRNIPWEGVELRGLRKDGSEIPVLIAFGEFFRGQKRIFTGFAREIVTGIGVGR
jgi:PAS domain S-box-containing protein